MKTLSWQKDQLEGPAYILTEDITIVDCSTIFWVKFQVDLGINRKNFKKTLRLEAYIGQCVPLIFMFSLFSAQKSNNQRPDETKGFLSPFGSEIDCLVGPVTNMIDLT